MDANDKFEPPLTRDILEAADRVRASQGNLWEHLKQVIEERCAAEQQTMTSQEAAAEFAYVQGAPADQQPMVFHQGQELKIQSKQDLEAVCGGASNMRFETIRLRPKNKADRELAIQAARNARGNNRTIIIEPPSEETKCVTM